MFQDGDEARYIEALSLAMKTSYENGLYQFAYMQCHMLFMTMPMQTAGYSWHQKNFFLKKYGTLTTALTEFLH